jgi:hypothetical protein
MSEDLERLTDVERALASGDRLLVGRYVYDLATEVWWWSDETYTIHGFEPGDVVPTTAMILAHKHPDDRERVRAVLQEARATAEPFSSVHRIMDAHGQSRTLVVTGQGRRDLTSGDVVELTGYFVDVTATIAARASQEASAAIAASARSRATIEQAKGALAVLLGVDPETSFELLRARSNDINVPVRELARWVLDRVGDSPRGTIASEDGLFGWLGAKVADPGPTGPGASTA